MQRKCFSIDPDTFFKRLEPKILEFVLKIHSHPVRSHFFLYVQWKADVGRVLAIMAKRTVQWLLLMCASVFKMRSVLYRESMCKQGDNG